VVHRAAEAFNLELVSFLLTNGANIHARVAREVRNSGFDTGPTIKAEGNTPLHLAITSAHSVSVRQALEVARALLDYGADIEAKDVGGKTPLLLAISTKVYYVGTYVPNEKLVNWLLERGAYPHAVDGAGRTASQLANDIGFMFDEAGKFVRKPVSLQSSVEGQAPSGPWFGRGTFGRDNPQP
jgi:ankyrin repeat protein